MGAVWTRIFKEEFTVQKLRLFSKQPELLLQPKWNIPVWTWLVYRFSMLVYTLAWCVYAGLSSNTPKWLIFLTHLSYCLMGLYYLMALWNLAAAYTVVRRLCQTEHWRSSPGCQGTSIPFPGWLRVTLALHWFLHVAQGALALTVTVLYWTIIYPTSRHPLSGFNINFHLVNSLQTLVDLALSSTPVHLAHYLYLLLTGALYVLFVLLYWLSGSTNIRGQPYIYAAFDFVERPLAATLAALGFTLVCLPLFHFALWNAQLLRDKLAAGSRARRWALPREGWEVFRTGVAADRPKSITLPAPSVFGPKCEDEARGDQLLSPLTTALCSYQAVPSAL